MGKIVFGEWGRGLLSTVRSGVYKEEEEEEKKDNSDLLEDEVVLI